MKINISPRAYLLVEQLIKIGFWDIKLHDFSVRLKSTKQMIEIDSRQLYSLQNCN